MITNFKDDKSFSRKNKKAEDIIVMRDLCKFFGEGERRVEALKDVNITIQKGDFVAITGQSGSGKTTMMNVLGCLDSPTGGTYYLFGEDTGKLSPDMLAKLRGRVLGFIFQRYDLLPTLNSLENASLPAVYAGVPGREREGRAGELLNLLGLSDKLQSLPFELSGGQQQRVSIARALMNGANIILADEPSGALDSQNGEKVMDILENLHREGHTVILVTHDAKIASRAHRLLELKDGVITKDVRVKELGEVKEIGLSEPKVSAFSFYKGRIAEAFMMSIKAIRSRKIRSLLTMLGIVIGIASVVTVVALGRGSRDKILENIRSLGSDVITINPGTGFGDRRSGRVRTLTVEDSVFLGKQSYLKSATPIVSSNGILVYGNKSLNASLTGAGEGYFEIRGLSMAKGRPFNALDVRENASVVVIEETAATEIFGEEEENPIGKTIIFGRRPLTVIGVVKKEESPFGQQNSLNLWAPFTMVMSKLTGERHISSVIVKVREEADVRVAEKNITALLTVRHGGRKDFHTQNSDTIRKTAENATATMTFLIASVALVSLVVGGIGVMNIMLVSVTERTREIGVRMAVGARRLDILLQFLIEAVLLCLLGGIAGIALSGLSGFIFNKFSENFHMSLYAGSILLALLFSTLIGLLFGFIPARDASKLNPIDALARE
jgi:macrolide transport system ATP-binding/permease protein